MPIYFSPLHCYSFQIKENINNQKYLLAATIFFKIIWGPGFWYSQVFCCAAGQFTTSQLEPSSSSAGRFLKHTYIYSSRNPSTLQNEGTIFLSIIRYVMLHTTQWNIPEKWNLQECCYQNHTSHWISGSNRNCSRLTPCWFNAVSYPRIHTLLITSKLHSKFTGISYYNEEEKELYLQHADNF
jgi:hypothetical protein